MQINVTVSDLEAIDLNTVIGEDVSYYNPETEETEYRPRTLGDVLIERMVSNAVKDTDIYRGILRKRVHELRDEMIRAQIEPMIAAAMTGPIHLTNSYGEPTGKATTMRELIQEQVTRFITPGTGSFREPSAFQKLLAQEVNRQFTKELTDAIGAEKDKARKLVRDHAAKVVADTVISLAK